MSQVPSHIINLNLAPSNNLYPEFLYMDANAIIDFTDLDSQNIQGSSIRKYLKDLHQNDGMVVWSNFGVEEVINHLHYNEYANYADQHNILGHHYANGGNKKPWKVAEDTVTPIVAKQISNNVIKQKEQVFGDLEKYGVKLDSIDDDELLNLAEKIFLAYGGSVQDAKHVAYAMANGANSILTNDGGFAKYSHLNIFGNSRSLLNRQQAITLLPDSCCDDFFNSLL